MELNYNRDLLKSVLTMLKEHDMECGEMVADKIVIFNSKYTTKQKDDTALSSDPKYYELAHADFTIHTDDQLLKERFDAIKKCILKNRKES
jgi:hypothetical protein